MKKGRPLEKPNVLIVDDIHEIFLSMLSDAGIPYVYRPDIDLEEAKTLIGDFDGLVIRSKFKVGKEFLDCASQLRMIARGGAGMDNIDEHQAQEREVTLLNAPEGNRDAVGEHMLGMLLTLMNNYVRADKEIRNGLWRREENRGEELMGKTVGLIGYGNNGHAMARKLAGFGVNVLAYDKYKTDYTDHYARQASMDELFAEAEILSLHIPLTAETKNLVNDHFISNFKKSFYFLNGARGEIVNVAAVVRALESRKIKAAAFDVLPIEKFPALSEAPWYNDLVSNERVLLSPHVAGWTFESYYKIAYVLAKKVIAFYQG
ncbi:NAD(P)-dependent oxidoreductase [Olivibacter sitiensis]|uniref:NAD(P)-dependent oxidoreductase n=1 Tax=Olivibacter sitiensis TaxID=376470 RepID=UPI00041490F9|nr:NAD(P)-dependent oxidoreductase [Olivibacter sitiensis]